MKADGDKLRIHLVNAQRALRVDRKLLLPYLHWLGRLLGRRTPGLAWGPVVFVLLDDAAMQEMNRRHLGHDRVTDVITFRLPAVPGSGYDVAGEILVNAQRARAEGRRRGSTGRELALYLAHGIDHLCGADDHTPARRRAMRRREQAWLRQAARLFPGRRSLFATDVAKSCGPA